MPYATEDEIDWSDGTLHTPAPAYYEPDTTYTYPRAMPVDDEKYDSIFESNGDEQLSFLEQDRLPNGLPLDLAQSHDNYQHTGPSRVYDAGNSAHVGCRIPSREDYMDFALYQANQKAYEATMLKQFIAHALHLDQVNKCFDGKGDPRVKIDRYMALISGNVDKIANKMIWNAHHRVISMLANEGKESASFLHIHNLKEGLFAEFGPGSTSRPARKLSESWHRAYPEPVMVQLSTTEYPIGRHSHPLEDIDDLADTSANNETFSEPLPRSRPTKALMKKKKKGQDMLGADYQEKLPSPSHRNRLQSPRPSSQPHVNSDLLEVSAFTEMPRAETRFDHFRGTHEARYEREGNQSFADNLTHPYGPNFIPTQLELLLECHGASDRAVSSAGNHNSSAMEKVTSWPVKLLNDHKRRLTERWSDPPQALETILPGFEQILAQTIAKGCRPTVPNWRKRADIIAFRERSERISNPIAPVMEDASTAARKSCSVRDRNGHREDVAQRILPTTIPTKPTERPKPSTSPAAKKRKVNAPGTKAFAARSHAKQKTVTPRRSSRSGAKDPAPPADAVHPPHPSGSVTLEFDQSLPPDAYFEAKSLDEKPVWRCSIKHAMGHYYNAGDRKTCRGCNTSLMDIPKAKHMDFFLPRRQFFHQPAAGMRWKPCRPYGKGRKSDRPCHNSIAKDAFWAAVDAGATEDEARQIGCNAVVEFLRPKPRKVPTPEPTPEPEPDLGPHPSGSNTMEHGQDLPECAYWKKQERHEELAWRCDVSHGLGRYYLAGDKKSCPGCGTNKGGLGRQTIMDFYLPPGTMLRQEAPGLVKWKPRQYKARTSGNAGAAKSNKGRYSTHNQICAERYFQAKAEGYGDEQALNLAVEHTDNWLDGKQGELAQKHKEQDDAEPSSSVLYTATVSSASHPKSDSTNTSPAGCSSPDSYHRNSRGGCTFSLIPTKRSSGEWSDEDTDRAESDFGDDEGSAEHEMHGVPPYHEIFENSSAEEESSGSDSE